MMRLVEDFDRSRASDARSPDTSLLEELWSALDVYLEAIDRLPFLVTLAAAATTALDGEPLWLLLVGAPSGGKTEAIRLVEDVADESIGELTGAASLLAWTKGRTPKPCGLLTRLPARAFVTIRDLSPLLASSDRGGRDEVYAKLRDIYDGKCRREVGQQPTALEWMGRLTLAAAVTPAIDNYSSHAQALGDRWLYLRLAGSDAQAAIAKGMRALHDDSDRIGAARQHARVVAVRIIGQARARIGAVSLDGTQRRVLADAAFVVSRARAVVPRHGYGRREIDGVPVIEEVPRLARQLGLLVRGLLALGVSPDSALGAGVRAAVESVTRPAPSCSTRSATASRSPSPKWADAPDCTATSCVCNSRSSRPSAS